MMYEEGKTYSIKNILEHYFNDNACSLEDNIYLNIIKNTIRKLDELNVTPNLEDVKIKYLGMQMFSQKPIAMVWVFDCDSVLHTSFWVKL